MKRFNLVLAAAAAATLTLSACDITITGPPAGPPPPDETVAAPSTPYNAVWDGTLARGQSLIFKLSFPAAGSRNVVYLELDQDLRLELNDPTTFNVVASSHGPDFFAPKTAGLFAASVTDLAPQAIGTTQRCRGSCIIMSAKFGNTYYARVTNDSGSAVNTNVYFYGDVQQDQEEPNDTPGQATYFDMSALAGDNGAIELLYDVDFWKTSGPGTVEFKPASGNPLELRLAVVNSAGTVIAGPIGPGSISVFANDILKVYSNNNRAGAPARSHYNLLGQ
ncbi:MAG: hypothetical protein ROY82_07285 [Truepera sp.]|nr:hypothetical protein [Truepera sp.]